MRKYFLIIIFILVCSIGGFFIVKSFYNNTNNGIESKDNADNSPSENNQIEKIVTNKDRATDLMKTMSLEEKIGQMFYVRCRKDSAINDLDKYHVGGYILFDADVKGETKDSLKNTLQSYQDKSKINLLIGVDEEGGLVNRLSRYSSFRATPFLSPQNLDKKGGLSEIATDTKEKSALLKSLGINNNLAPVCDVSTDPNDFIYDRTFGKNANETSEYIKTVVTNMKENNIISTLKHFPGYGNNVDTHTGISIDTRSYDNFKTSDFLPFIAGVNAGADTILVSHNIVNSMDKDLPASLSPKVHEILRNELNFNGVVMTDDLQMDAISKYIGNSTSAVLAIKAGNDLLIASDFDIQIPSVIDAVNKGDISVDRINESVERILEMKYNLGIINN